MVIDADGLNILSANREWLKIMPEGTILTPHPREFERMAGKAASGSQRNKMQIEFAGKHRVIVVLKGAYTSIAMPDGNCYFNSTGNPGMATAGSGDVLTGMILSLLGQGYKPDHAALLGVYLHGLSGDLAAAKSSEEAVIAGDIIENIGRAFNLSRES
jgi:NAD(P)H-hydrate epimerase